jgi:hypothetical protein
MDWTEACRILGVSESATEAEIKEQYIYKAQLLHPDKNQDKPENIRKKAEIELALVNQAYTYLINPNNNPYKFPPKLSVEPLRIRFKNVNIGERKTTVITVKNVGGPYTSIWIDNQPAPWLAVTGVKSIGAERLPLEVVIEATGTGQPGNEYASDLVIKLENENSHALDQAAVKVELFTAGRPGASSTEKESRVSPEPETQVKSKNRLGLGIGAFLLDILAFSAIGTVVGFIVYMMFSIDQMILIGALILYALIAFGISFNHALSVGSKTNRNKIKNQKTAGSSSK